MKIIDHYWIKPFGTGMSCLQTIDGECPRGLTVEQCIEQCKSSPFCNAGYHISFPSLHIPSYCAPLNTVPFNNTNFLNNVILPNNETKLSSDNDIQMKLFYNEQRFPDSLDLLQEPFLFLGDTVFLCQDRQHDGLWYLQSDFNFSPFKDSAITITIGEPVRERIVDYDIRITSRSTITFFKTNDFNLLGYRRRTKKWAFQPYHDRKVSFQFVHPKNQECAPFINEGIRFQLRSIEEQQFLHVVFDATRNVYALTFSSQPSMFDFFFLFDRQNKVNQTTRLAWYKHANDPSFMKSMTNFICHQFPNCTARSSTSLYQHYPFFSYLSLCLFVGCVIIMVMLLFVVFLSYRKKDTPAKLKRQNTIHKTIV